MTQTCTVVNEPELLLSMAFRSSYIRYKRGRQTVATRGPTASLFDYVLTHAIMDVIVTKTNRFGVELSVMKNGRR